MRRTVPLSLAVSLVLALALACAEGHDPSQHEARFTFESVDEADRATVRRGVQVMRDWLTAQGFGSLRGVHVYAFGNLDALLATMDAAGYFVRGIDPLEMKDLFSAGGAVAIERNAFLYLGADWSEADDVERLLLVAHEVFHTVQFGLGAFAGSRQVAASVPGPDWIIEGSASWAATAALDLAGLFPLEAGREHAVHEARTQHAPLPDIEAYSPVHTPGDAAPYALGFMATDLLARQNGPASIVQFWSNVGKLPSWDRAFLAVFGEPIRDFYDRYAAEREAAFAPHAGRLEGIVLRPDQRGAWGATVVACPVEETATRCSGTYASFTGHFTLAIPPGRYTLSLVTIDDAYAIAGPHTVLPEGDGEDPELDVTAGLLDLGTLRLR